MFQNLGSRGFALTVGIFCTLFVISCASNEHNNERKAVAVTVLPDNLPAPVSVAVKTSQEEAPQDPIVSLKERLHEIGAERLLMVRARIKDLTASKKVLPETLHWGKVPHIVTALTLEVAKTYCGNPLKKVSAFYVGGRLSDGSVERTELMPSDLIIGDDHIFILRKTDDKYFLELGREDMLRKHNQDKFLDTSRNAITLDEIKGVCP